MADDGNELFAQLCILALLDQFDFCALQVFFGFNLQREQARKGLHRGLYGAVFKTCRFRVQRAEGAEKSTVGAKYRNRNVTLETIHFWRVMALVQRICAGLVDDDRQM